MHVGPDEGVSGGEGIGMEEGRKTSKVTITTTTRNNNNNKTPPRSHGVQKDISFIYTLSQIRLPTIF